MTKRCDFILTERLHALLYDLAAERHSTMSGVLRVILEEYFTGRGEDVSDLLRRRAEHESKLKAIDMQLKERSSYLAAIHELKRAIEPTLDHLRRNETKESMTKYVDSWVETRAKSYTILRGVPLLQIKTDMGVLFDD